ncbi:MAG TPA: energy transducer TonB [Candidatus Angelobacter sp.]|nr:energy transducer TonB [Candidatus Angelobacter sp.]
MLPRQVRTRGLLASTGLHVALVAALIWLPILFPSPVVVENYVDRKLEVAADYQPLVMPALPQLKAVASGGMQPAAPAPRGRSAAAQPADTPPPLKRDYAGPQEIVSYFPHAVNRVQSIRRPDLVSPPNLKFPLRLKSMVMLPSQPVPVLAPAPREEARQLPPRPIARNIEIPIPEPTVELPKLVSVPAVPAEDAPPKPQVSPQPSAASISVAVETLPQRKSVIVVNAVSVASDPAVQVPDAQLAGNFVVGPSLDTTAPVKSAASGTGRFAEVIAPKSGPSTPNKGSGAGAEVGSGAGSTSNRAPGAGNGNRESTARGTASSPGTGAGGGVPGRGNGNGSASGRGTNSGGSGGISISGGIPGRSGAPVDRALPMNRSYGLTIISGGSSGGAGRDMGVFDRSETVFSVAIPMADAGGGMDWPMQYAMLNHAQPGAGLLVPPFAQKKVAATIARSQTAGEQGPVFISGVIDETGKLQALRSLRAQDLRSQLAIQALQQWQFLPAQLDGRPVASKVLIGVIVREGE